MMVRSQTLPRERTTLINDGKSVSPIVRIVETQPSPYNSGNRPHQHQHRPASLYDNLQRNMSGSGATISSASGAMSVGNLTAITNNGQNNSNRPVFLTGSSTPHVADITQANGMATTVPANITNVALANRHTPTRSSLRHSRMIVQRTRKVSKKYHPRVMRHHRLATALVALQTLMGVATTLLSGWLLVWAPHLNTRDIPYWSGIPLLASGIVGLMLLCCCRKEYPGKPGGIFNFALKVLSVSLSSVASIACFCASTFATYHLVMLGKMVCEPANVLNASCYCQSPNTTAIDARRSYKYVDLNCPEVDNILSVLLIGSAAANAIAGVLTTWYVFLHWHSRYTNLYSEVKTTDENPIVIGNKMDPTILNKN